MPNTDQIVAAIDAISDTQQLTSFYDVLAAAIANLDASGTDQRVIVLFSDGEDTGLPARDGYTDANNPVLLAQQFKDSGGVIICLGCRASGDGFTLLSLISTGGFFVNGYSSTAADALDYISGLKGYVCAGNCTPTGDVIVGQGALNYNLGHSFINWDVTGGFVDLIGNSFFDFLPGNGLYVDLAGSNSTAAHIINGRMVSNAPFSLTGGHSYRLQVLLAGNQRQPGTYSAKVQVFYKTGSVETALLSQSIIISDYRQDFEPYSFTFTAPAGVDAYVSIQQQDIPSGNNPNFGILLGQVKLTDARTLSTLLNDDFEGENPVYVPPACGTGTTFINGGYATGTNCYGEGCLDSPPAAQSPDPSPLPNIEAGGYTPPTTYTSTKTACASCLVGSKNVVISECVVGSGGGSGACASSDPGVVSFPLIVLTPPDGSSIVRYTIQAGTNPVEQAPKAWQLFGSDSLTDEAAWNLIDSQSGIAFTSGQSKDFNLVSPREYAHYRLRVYQIQDCAQPAMRVARMSLWAVAVAPVQQICESGTGTGASQQAADDAAIAAALAIANPQLNCMAVYSATETVKVSCPIGGYGPDVSRSATAISFVSQQRAEKRATDAATALALSDLDCTQSNNDQVITLPAAGWNQSYYAQATPLPSVKFVSEAGTVGNVSVTLKHISVGVNGSSFLIALRSPSGTWVILWSGLGTASVLPGGTTITFDDAGIAMPNPIADGDTYTLNNGGMPPALTMPAGMPAAGAGDYKFTLADFIGEDANGGWSLYCVCRLTQAVTIDGWDLTIT